MKKLLCVLLLLTTRLLAVNPVPFTEALTYTYKIDGSGTCILTIYDETGTNQLMTTASGSTIESGLGTASMIPGKTYTLEFWGLGPPDYTMSFTAPTGYSVYVNGVATNLVSYSPGTGWHYETYMVELRPSAGDAGGMWGQFSGISLGKAISWGVGLGDLRTGRSAGGIQFRAPSLSGSPASRDMIYYATPPANVGQVVVIKDGPSNTRLRQIVTPIGFTDLVDVTGGYEIRCYLWGQVASWNGTIYTFSGSPWKTIKVESPATNQLKITETQGAVVRVSNLVGSGFASASGGTITTAGGYTIHTFNSSGTFTVNSGISSVDYLVVAGGGGGGANAGGGGGAGQMLTGSFTASPTAYTVSVGGGGTGAHTNSSNGVNGVNSQISGSGLTTITALGGGGGASYSVYAGTAGGSGGGGCMYIFAGTGTGGNGSAPGGNTGGTANYNGSGSACGGGGGAGGPGATVNTSGFISGNGGVGLASSISGTSTYYAGGGGGGGQNTFGGGTTAGSGGLGGGGAGATPGGNGTANTGGGGGGGSIDNAHAPNGGDGGSGVVIIRYLGDPRAGTWTLQEGDGTTIARTTVHTSTVSMSSQRDDVVTVYNGNSTSSGDLVSKTKYHYVDQAWGEELDSVIADPGSATLTTSYTYYTNSANLGNYRRVQSVTKPTGDWTVYQYYDDWDRRGQLQYQIQPWQDSPALATSASTTTGHVIYFQDYVADWTGRHTRPTARLEYLNNTQVGQITWSHGDVTGSGDPRATMTINTYRDATNYYTNYAESYRADADPDFAGQQYLGKGANLAQTSVSISRGTFNTTTKAFAVSSSGDHWRELKFNGSTSSTGADSVTSFDSQSCPAVYLIPYKSTLQATIRIAQGYVYRVATYVYTGSGSFSLMTAEDFEYDSTGNLTQRWASTGNGAVTSYVYTNGRLTSQCDPTGIETQYTYDPIGRVATSIKKGASASGSYAAQSDITTTYTYDGAGHVTQTVTSGDSLSQTATAAYDLAGRLTSSTAPGSYTTSQAYSSGGRIVTTTLPGGATKITETYPDGQPKSVTGTAVVAEYFGYRVIAGGFPAQDHWLSSSGSPAWTSKLWNWDGSIYQDYRIGGDASYYSEYYIYNGKGQLDYIWHSDGKGDHCYEYNTLGQVVREGDDLTSNGVLDLATSDRITDYARTFFTSSSNWWLRETTSTYATTGSGTATQVAKVETQLSGLATNRLALKNTYDIYGNLTSQYTDVDRSGKKVYVTTDVPDSSADAQQVSYNGLQMSARDTTGLTMTYGYDALGRQTTSIDLRTGTTTTAYVSGTNQVSTVADPAHIVQAAYTYDGAGRVSSVKDALNKYTYYAYTMRNEKYHVWGDNTYPVEYAYDSYGRQITMKTFRGGNGWTSSDWPGTGSNTASSPGTADTTTWTFQNATGLLSSKADDAGNAVSYTYTQAGQIATRTWARGTVTTYSYSATTRELTGVSYSSDPASTPGLTYSYNRMGNIATVADATGTRTFNYNLGGTLELQNEVLGSAFYGDRRITRGYDTTAGTVGRYNNLSVGSATSPAGIYSQSYGYDGFGRLNSTLGGSVVYSYLTNSNLIQSTSAPSWNNFTDTRTYDPKHDWIVSRVTTVSSSVTPKAAFAYTQDNLGRVTFASKTGEIFNQYGNTTQGLDTAYGYDDRSQLTSEQTKLGGTSTVLTGRNDAHAYDTFGNRASTAGVTHNGNAANYTTNALNQYTLRTVPGFFDVAGSTSGTTVTVSTTGGSTDTATRHGPYFFDGYAVANASTAAYSTLTIHDGITSPDPTLPAFVAKTPEVFAYDVDGNLTSDGRWDYSYDAENRLVSAQTHVSLLPDGAVRRLEFKYDYLGRRVQKTVRSDWNSSTSVFATVTSSKFAYDGWNLLFEWEATTMANVRAHVWGLDLSGTLQGAGGVGGLLYTYDYASGLAMVPVLDGNGNVHGYLNTANGSLLAAYEYDAFGQTIRESGTYTASTPFRFSTKYTDLDTGLVYYGLRYYSPSLGRFINKDPIEERGGLNLYAFCTNSGVNRWDYLGMHIRWIEDSPGGHSTDAQGNTVYWNGTGHWQDDGQNDDNSATHETVDLNGNGDPFDNLRQLGNPLGVTQTLGLIDPATGSTLAINIHNASSSDMYQANHAMFNTVANFDYSQNVVAPSSGAGAAAWNGAYQYLTQFNQNLLNLGQNTVNLAGASAGYVANLLDSGTRGTTLSDAAQEFKALGSVAAWQQYGNYLISPQGLADTTFAIDLTLAGGLKGSNCFPAGTKVSTSHGDVNIEDIKVGDLVYAYDFEIGAVIESHVLDIPRHFTYNWMSVTIDGETIRATRGHRFWVESEKRWIEAVDLKEGMSVRLSDGRIVAITSVSLAALAQSETTYNLEIEKVHTYFVGTHHVLVHNPTPDFIVTPGGQVFPVPAGSTGPSWMDVPGLAFTGGSGGNGLDSRVTDIVFRDSNWNQGPRVSYYNTSGQKVDPSTGRTISDADPLAHMPCW